MMYLDVFARQDGAAAANPAINPKAQPATILGGSTALFVASVGLVGLRFWSRIMHRTSRGWFGLWWDDWMALIALIAYIPAFALVCAIFAPHAGRHIQEFSYEQQAIGGTALNAFALFFMYSMFAARCSALLFYHRVFVTGSKDWFRWVLVALQGYNLCALVAFMSLLPFNCRMTDTTVDRTRSNCLGSRTMYIGSAAASFSSDLLILIAPMLRISRLQLSSRLAKLMVTIPFTCGIIVVGVSLGRLIVTVLKADVLDEDPSFSGMEVMWWPIAEMAAALVSVCLPSIYGLVRTRLQDGHTVTSNSSLETGSSGGMLIEKSITIGTPPPGGSPQRESTSSASQYSPNVAQRPLPPTPPQLVRGHHTSTVSTVCAARPPPVSEGVQELPCSGPSRTNSHTTPKARQSRRPSRNRGRVRMPRSIYCVMPPTDGSESSSVPS